MNIPTQIVLILLAIGVYYAIRTLKKNGTGCKSCARKCSCNKYKTKYELNSEKQKK